MSLNKVGISENIPDQYAYLMDRSEELIETTLEIVKNELESGNNLLLGGFGNFQVAENNFFSGRNLETGD
ncbi:MAG: HU family DNA-binding protein [Desulfatiglandales bacterium]